MEKLRTVWISDVHLGTRGCQAEYLLNFLRNTECDTLYLVGDIIDFWALKRSRYWPQSHNNVVRSVLGKAKHGTKVVFIPGNHDEPLRDYVGACFGNLSIERDAIHTTADGTKLLVLHGDEFDNVIRYSKFLAHVGDIGYELLLKLNRYYNFFRRKLGYSYWSLSAYLKHKVKNAVNAIGDYEKAVVTEARKRGVDGVVCGHIHHPEISQMEDILYINDGDWVESCTALVEEPSGELKIVHWSDHSHTVKALPSTVKLNVEAAA